ncbi:hypothetical protein BDV93DRAFT_566267 [Ceratobasidium sp. AG-I]|nr:hypothetical protein BDV93DRAFT_566267 [Ceratobasidium sp. AG-I]
MAIPGPVHFVAYALHRTRLHAMVTSRALYLLLRLKHRFTAARGSSGHRLYISAFMIASKVIYDTIYSNESWSARCAGASQVLNVRPEDLRDSEAVARKEYGTAPTAPLAAPVPIARAPAAEPRKQSADFNANPHPSPVSTPPSPSHSNSTSPASSTCQTPPSADPVKVPTKDVAPVEESTVCVRRAQCLVIGILLHLFFLTRRWCLSYSGLF